MGGGRRFDLASELVDCCALGLRLRPEVSTHLGHQWRTVAVGLHRHIVFGPVTKRKAILVTQNMPLELRDFSGIGWRTSQCSTILPCSSRKISTTANPSSSD